MIIKVKTSGPLPKIIKVGDWIDLYLPTDVTLPKVCRSTPVKEIFIDFGIAMQLPKGFEGWLSLRSSTFKKWGIILSNAIGIIDQSYCSDNDTWKTHCIVLKDRGERIIPAGTRIAQFRIMPSQKATFWQKLKGIFSSKITIKQVNTLGNPERGGYGSTGE